MPFIVGNYLYVYDSEESRKRLVVTHLRHLQLTYCETWMSDAAYIAQWSRSPDDFFYSWWLVESQDTQCWENTAKKEIFPHLNSSVKWHFIFRSAICSPWVVSIYCAMVHRLVFRVVGR